MKNIIAFILLILAASCSRYHFKNNGNPFLPYDIKSISVPTFVNWSIVPNASGPMTSSFTNLLMDYAGLKVYSYENTKADAILVGIIQSKKRRREVFKNTSYQTTKGSLKDSIGERRDFYVPKKTEVYLTLRLLLIKDPTVKEYELARSKAPVFMRRNPKVIFDETIELSASISRSIQPASSPLLGGATNFTKSRKSLGDAVSLMARSATQTFKKEIIDAF